MANILEYTISLQDKVSAVLRKIGINNDMALNKFAALEKQSAKVGEAFQKMGRSVSTLNDKIDLLKAERDILPVGSLAAIKTYNSEIGRLERQVSKLQTISGNPIKRMFGQALNSLPGLATNPLVIAGAGMGAAIRKGMEADMQKANMLTLFRGNEEAAKEMFDKISKYGAESPYEKGPLIDVQKTMMGFGIEANKSFEVLTQLGDIAMGDEQKMTSLALAFSQATSAGKLQGQDLNQMINAGFNPLQVISERTGESMVSLKERMGKGKLGADELAKSFEWATDKQGLFYKGAEKAGATLGGKWSTMVDSFNEMLLSVYNAIAPLLMPIIKLATGLLNTIGGAINTVVTKLREGNGVFTGVAVAIGIIASALLVYNGYLAITTALQSGLTLAAWKTNFAFLANPVFLIIAGIVALIAAIAYLIYAYDGWGAAWNNLLTYMKLGWELFKNNFTILWEETTASFMQGVYLIEEAWYKLKSLWNEEEANAGLAKIQDKQNEHATRIAAARNKSEELQAAMAVAAAKTNLVRNDKSFADVKAAIGAKIGIGTPKLPGANGDNDLGDGDEKKLSTKGGKSNDAIATGGTKSTTIHITIGNQVGTLNLGAGNFTEGVKKMKDTIIDELTRAVQMGAALGGSQ